MKTDKQASKAAEEYLLTVFKKGNSKRDTLWKNVRKGVIGLKKLLKSVKFLTLKLKIFLKRINPPKLEEFNRQKEHINTFGRLLYLAIRKQINI